VQDVDPWTFGTAPHRAVDLRHGAARSPAPRQERLVTVQRLDVAGAAVIAARSEPWQPEPAYEVAVALRALERVT
jgi:hypothetical protein